MLGARAKDEENTQKTSDYDTTMDFDVENNNNIDKNTWRNIYEEIDEGYFVKVKLFTRAFINLCKNRPNEPQNIPTDIKNNIKTRIGRKFICPGGEDLS